MMFVFRQYTKLMILMHEENRDCDSQHINAKQKKNPMNSCKMQNVYSINVSVSILNRSNQNSLLVSILRKTRIL